MTLNFLKKENSFVERNARSTTVINGDQFIKTSNELDLNIEARELQRCKDLDLTTPHVMPVEFLNFDQSSNELTTKFIQNGQTLFNKLWNESSLVAYLRSNRLDFSTLLERMEEIGKWLSNYHKSTTYPEHGPVVSANILTDFRSKLNFALHNHLLDEQFIARLENRYLPEIEKLVDTEYQIENHIRLCRVHGDFIAYNMFVDQNWNISILDFADTRIGASIEDVVRFCDLFFALSQTSSIRKNIFPTAIKSFLNGYQIPADIYTSPFFKSIRVLNGIIHLISEHYIRPYIISLLITKLELKRITRASLKWITADMSS